MIDRISRSRLEIIPAGTIQTPSVDSMIFFAQTALKKQRQRSELLREHPEARLHLDPAPLRDLLPGSALVCYTGSSLARDRAIRGSDIDGAIVITHTMTSPEQQKEYVYALRKQGFTVYSPEQISKIENGRYLDERLEKKKDVNFKVISFETYEDFEQKRRSGASLVHVKFFTIYADEEQP